MPRCHIETCLERSRVLITLKILGRSWTLYEPIVKETFYRQTSIQRTVWEAKSTVRCIEIRFIENAWKKMGKFFKRNLLLDLIHFLKILIYFADNDTKLTKISIKIQIFVKKLVIVDFDSVVINTAWV